MYYKLTFDMDLVDESIKKETSYIYAEDTNMDEIKYEGIKEGFFDNIILKKFEKVEWPNVEFYYSSKVSNKESDYLLNIKRWPLVHERVKEILIKKQIQGVRFYPIKLIDVVTGKININYFLMYVENFVDAFDMEKSKYRYNEKYDFYTFIPGQIYIDEEKCATFDIFRCEKSLSGIYVSEKIYNIINANQFTGFYFEEQL